MPLCDSTFFLSRATMYGSYAKRFAARSFARAATVSRSRGAAVVDNDAIKLIAEFAISSTARLKGSSFAWEGRVKPEILRTNCSDASRTSVSEAGGSKLNSGRMLRHIAVACARPAGDSFERPYGVS